LPHAWTIVFYFTPVIWQPNQIKSHLSLLFRLNPIYYVLEVIRSPLMGKPVSADIWMGALITIFLSSSLGYVVFANMRKKISLWL